MVKSSVMGGRGVTRRVERAAIARFCASAGIPTNTTAPKSYAMAYVPPADVTHSSSLTRRGSPSSAKIDSSSRNRNVSSKPYALTGIEGIFCNTTFLFADRRGSVAGSDRLFGQARQRDGEAADREPFAARHVRG